MRNAMPKALYIAVVALVLVVLAASPLAAQPPTTTFLLNGIGSGANLAGVYTSPYTGQVNAGSSPTIPVICDDFSHDTYNPEEWTAYVTPLSTLVSGQTDAYLQWKKSATTTSVPLDQATAYTVAAVLANDILGSTAITQEEYSFALWGLFDADAFSQLSAYYGSSNIYLSQAQQYLNSAVDYVLNNNLTPSNYANVTIYSYDPSGMIPKCGANLTSTCATLPPQEFLTVSMAEPAAPVLLIVDLLAVVSLVCFVRRRQHGTSVS